MHDDPLYLEAVERLRDALRRAEEQSIPEPGAVALATTDSAGRPWCRMVLLRGLDPRGLVFYTNADSSKGSQLAANPCASLCLYWEPLKEQARIDGDVEPVEDDESDAYWATRPRASRLAAWASRQSQPLDSRETLERSFEQLERRFADGDVPRPGFWRGYRVIPRRIEFWNGRPARLHERVVYEAGSPGWTRGLLFP